MKDALLKAWRSRPAAVRKVFVALLLTVASVSFGGAARSQTADAGAEVLSFGWKYEGYTPVETIDSRSGSTSVHVRRRKGYVFKYRAQAAVRNTGAKAVRVVHWDYVFLDAEKGKELKRYKFQTRQQVPPGEARVVFKDMYIEPDDGSRHITDGRQKVFVTRLEFEDGTDWRP